MDCKDCRDDKMYESIVKGWKSHHHHCATCGAWQFGSDKPDVYGHGECYPCAVKRVNEGDVR